MVTMEDNSAQILAEFHEKLHRAQVRMGNAGVRFAQNLCPKDTGALRNSISFSLDGNDVQIGTNTPYALYVEAGTGEFATLGGGRPTPWHYKDGKGNWHTTRGQQAQPYLKPAVADHPKTYVNIVKDELQGG